MALLCCASFLLVYLVASLLLAIVAPAALRLAAAMRPRSAARLLFTSRMLPLILAGLVTTGLSLPSYLWLEPQATPERVGFGCLLAALITVGLWSVSLARAGAAVIRSAKWVRDLPKSHLNASVTDESCKVTLVEVEAPLLGMAGMLRPQVVLSSAVLRALSAEQLDAALRHENVHQSARDNFKRLLLLLAPNLWFFSHSLAALDRAWTKFSEWAADDDATQGDARMQLALAGALVCVAQLGTAPGQPALCTSLIADDRDLAARVLRLIDGKPLETSKTTSYLHKLVVSAALLTAGVMIAAIVRPSTFYAVHQLLERLVR